VTGRAVYSDNMLTIKGHFDGTAVVLDEPASLAVGQVVQVVVEPAAEPTPPPRRSLAGFAKGWFEMSDDFNDTPEDFAEYM
jgi:hypothetical protein